jgi:hypothetical protein
MALLGDVVIVALINGFTIVRIVHLGTLGVLNVVRIHKGSLVQEAACSDVGDHGLHLHPGNIAVYV